MPSVGGIDVGGTTIKAGSLLEGTFVPLGAARPTPQGAEAVIDVVADLVSELNSSDVAKGELAAVGVGVPGIVDDAAGIGVWSANLGWRDAPFRDLLNARLGLPVVFGHDVRFGAIAEARLGAGRGVDDLMFLPVGTGIAAAFVLDGRPYSAGGWSGEIGHVDVGHGERCACGLTGCLEAIASGGALVRRYTARSGRPVDGAAGVVAALRGGDDDAQAVWNDALDALAHALAWTASVLAPQVVVLGGGVAMAGDDILFDPLRERLEQRLSFQRRPRLVRATLGDRAGCIGAALAALDLIGAAQ